MTERGLIKFDGIAVTPPGSELILPHKYMWGLEARGFALSAVGASVGARLEQVGAVNVPGDRVCFEHRVAKPYKAMMHRRLRSTCEPVHYRSACIRSYAGRDVVLYVQWIRVSIDEFAFAGNAIEQARVRGQRTVALPSRHLLYNL